MHKNAVEYSIYLFIYTYVDANEIFSEVVLRRIHKDIEEDINLYEPTEGKLCFNELEVCQYCNSWPFVVKQFFVHTYIVYSIHCY